MDAKESATLISQLVDAIRGHQAHIDFESAIKDFPGEARGWKAAGAPHTAWQLLEHMRLAQSDILEFSRDPKHKSPKWPEGYWPKADAPPNDNAWDATVAAFRHDSAEFNKLIEHEKKKLFDPIPHREGQTLLREALLIASHNSYHLGQLVLVRKMYTERG